MIFVATMTYALGKTVGFEQAVSEFNHQIAHPSAASLPCARVISRLRMIDDVVIHHDAAATSIGKARSRAFAAGLAKAPDVYISVDDDVEADAFTLGTLIESALSGPNLAVAPCCMRGSNVVNVALELGPVLTRLPSGARTARCVSAGFGLVAMSGDTLRVIAESAGMPVFVDDDGERKPAAFCERLEAESWLGEDVAFCGRARAAGVNIEALTAGITMHAGLPCRLETLLDLDVVHRKPYEAPRIVRELTAELLIHSELRVPR